MSSDVAESRGLRLLAQSSWLVFLGWPQPLPIPDPYPIRVEPRFGSVNIGFGIRNPSGIERSEMQRIILLNHI